jgi:hypothetical protein
MPDLYLVDPLNPLTTSWEKEDRLERIIVKLTPDAPSASKGYAPPTAEPAKATRVYMTKPSLADISLLKTLAPDRPDIVIEAGNRMLDYRDSNNPIEDLAEANTRKRGRQQSREEEEANQEAVRIRINTLGAKSLASSRTASLASSRTASLASLRTASSSTQTRDHD